MNKAVDFEKVRRRRRRVVTLKRVFILAAITLLVTGAFFLHQILVEENLTVLLSDFRESMGGAGFPADLPGGVIRAVDNLGDNLTILNDTNLYIYSPKAKIVNNIQKMTDMTVAVTTASRVLTFTPGAKTFAVHSPSKELYPGSMEFGLICADMNERGDFAIVAPTKQFASKVFVYDKKFEEMYSWSSPEYVTNVAVSPNGGMMAVNCVSGEGGMIESQVYLFRFGEDKDKATMAMLLQDNLCLDLSFTEDERVEVLTDRQYLVLNSLGERKHGYDFAGGQVLAREGRDRETLLLMRDADGKSRRIVLLDASLSEKAVREVDIEVLDMALGRDSVYILTPDGIDVYGLDLELKAKLERKGVSHIHLVGNRLYYLTSDEIRILTQSELVGISKGNTVRKSLTG